MKRIKNRCQRRATKLEEVQNKLTYDGGFGTRRERTGLGAPGIRRGVAVIVLSSACSSDIQTHHALVRDAPRVVSQAEPLHIGAADHRAAAEVKPLLRRAVRRAGRHLAQAVGDAVGGAKVVDVQQEVARGLHVGHEALHAGVPRAVAQTADVVVAVDLHHRLCERHRGPSRRRKRRRKANSRRH